MNQPQPKSFQFSVRSLLIITAMVGGTLGLLQLCSLVAIWLQDERTLSAILHKLSPVGFGALTIISLSGLPTIVAMLLIQPKRPWLVFVFISLITLAIANGVCVPPRFIGWKLHIATSLGLALIVTSHAMMIEALIRRLWWHLITAGYCIAIAFWVLLIPFAAMAFA